jgi:C4-dicarboxylate transporter DctM subunit
MSSGFILLAFFAIMLITLFLGTPVSMSLGFAGVMGVLLWIGPAKLTQFGITAYSNATNMNQLILPMFIMMSEFLSQGGIAEDIFAVLNRGIGKFKGGLAIATTLACTIFAALCGSSPATAASIGKISIEAMTKRGYSPSFAVGTVAAGGTLGIMIPPSITFCVYAALTENSVVQLFMAGLIPGLMLAALLILSIIIRCRVTPSLLNYVPAEGVPAPEMTMADAREIVSEAKAVVMAEKGVYAETETETLKSKKKGPTFFTILPAFALILIVLGSMYFGFATPIGAAGYGVIGAFLITLCQRRLTKDIFLNAFRGTAKTGSMMVFLIICGMCMTFVVSYLGIPQEISKIIASSGLNRYVVLVMVYVLWFILGALMDPSSMVLLTIPFLYSTLMGLGFNPLWLGVTCVLASQIAMITPPVGMNLFVLRANTGIPMNQIIKGSLPYVGILVLGLLIITLFPALSTWLPSMMF